MFVVFQLSLLVSNDWKLSRKGGARNTPKTTPSYSSRMPVDNENLTGHRKSTGNPQTLPLTAQHQNAHNDISSFPHTPNTMAPPTSWVTPSHTITNPSQADRPSSSRTIAPGSPSSLTNGLELGWARVRGGAKGKGHPRQGHARPKPHPNCGH